MNMDGFEWKRKKWSPLAKVWFFLNEVAGSNICHVPIADHPEIARHISKRCSKAPVMIPYGADRIDSADVSKIRELGLEPDNYLVSIARIEPENSILEMVEAFSLLATDKKCVILGKLDTNNEYQMSVKAAGNSNVIFTGAIYDSAVVKALRFYCRAYLHGHQVGGTNPSLVEALGAGNAVIAHDNRFNRWTAGDAQFYFSSKDECLSKIKAILDDDEYILHARTQARIRHADAFQWDVVLAAYEKLLCDPN
jgi:glycosyltransferase involved in cell wall biosynthesis